MESRTVQPGEPARRLIDLAFRVWPALAEMDERGRRRGLSDLVGLLFSLPLALIGLAWLVGATDLGVLRRAWPVLALMVGLSTLFGYLSFYQFLYRREGAYSWALATLQPIVSASAVLLFGPTAIWLDVINEAIGGARDWRGRPFAPQRWNIIRNNVFNVAAATLSFLIVLPLYRRIGGQIPLPGLAPAPAALALLAVVAIFGLQFALFALYLLLLNALHITVQPVRGVRQYGRFVVMSTLPAFVFAVLAAAVYAQIGLAGYLFLMAGVGLASLLARRLSRAAEQSTQRSAELGQIEQLGRALLAAPPDTSTLPEILAEHVPPMFLYEQVEIRLFAGRTLLLAPSGAPGAAEELWAWLRSAERARVVNAGDPLPWSGQPSLGVLALAPIRALASGAPIGGICLSLSFQFDDPAAVLPALQSLAAQIASALHRADEYARDMAYQRVSQELELAAQIQASFLPVALPRIPGWQLAAMLRPARQTSGDFYDVLELPGGRLGLLIADVADKGTGAALFMALSRTLIRTYAFEHPGEPATVLAGANRRMLTDAHSSMFVTAFYGVLDTATGALTYANAGHNPPYLLGRLEGAPEPLRNTGIPLGIEAAASWRERTVTLAPCDTLLLYTDGVSEAQDERGELFGEERLLGAARATLGQPAGTVRDALIAGVRRFVGAAPQSDDLTVMVVVRE